jgi:hypothetical protein
MGRLSRVRPSRATLDPIVYALVRDPVLEEAREAREYWYARARSLPRRRFAARREAIELAHRWDRRLETAARQALLTDPRPALRALFDIRRARLARGLRRAATLGLGAVFAAAAAGALAVEALWHALQSLT